MNTDAQNRAVERLLDVQRYSDNGSERELAAIRALGVVGGVKAVERLKDIQRYSNNGSKREREAIEALAEAGRPRTG